MLTIISKHVLILVDIPMESIFSFPSMVYSAFEHGLRGDTFDKTLSNEAREVSNFACPKKLSFHSQVSVSVLMFNPVLVKIIPILHHYLRHIYTYDLAQND